MISGTAKSSSGPSESESESSGVSSGMSSSGSDYDPPWPPDDSEGSSSSSSCQCGFEVIEIVLGEDWQSGTFTIFNTGCGPIVIEEFIHSVSGTWDPALPVTIPEGGAQAFSFDSTGGDIRGTFVTIVSDCGEAVTIDWPLSTP